jgi:hypothetical protein
LAAQGLFGKQMGSGPLASHVIPNATPNTATAIAVMIFAFIAESPTARSGSSTAFYAKLKEYNAPAGSFFAYHAATVNITDRKFIQLKNG